MVRAKFRCTKIAKYADYIGVEVLLNPVFSYTKENGSFWNNEPSGSIELTITNPETESYFEVGKEYYIDFSNVSEAVD